MRAGSAFWPQTRIRKRGLAVSQNLRKRRFLKAMAAYVAVLFVFSLGYVWTRVQVVETGYRLRSLEVEQERLREENRSLLVEAATLKSPQRLAEIAKKIGLRHPTEDQIVFLKNKMANDLKE